MGILTPKPVSSVSHFAKHIVPLARLALVTHVTEPLVSQLKAPSSAVIVCDAAALTALAAMQPVALLLIETCQISELLYGLDPQKLVGEERRENAFRVILRH
jgi:hypothetical protein